ncbi:MAG: Rne/Rng family ribonuclease [Planctomycetes bacterium]|nr:Rne/Rng family ribonuclease [Planctomycetota bacterium]
MAVTPKKTPRRRSSGRRSRKQHKTSDGSSESTSARKETTTQQKQSSARTSKRVQKTKTDAQATPAKTPPKADSPRPKKGEKTSGRRRKEYTTTRRTTGRVMVVNVSQGEECRIAIVSDGKLEEIFFERQSAASHVGNIYKGVITNVEPGIQAAFIDFGIGKNGFLHISDLQPQYFPGRKRGSEDVGRKMARRDRPPIQRCLKRGDVVIVQVIKEGIGTKGPTLSTYLSIPGRYLVMMPGMSKLGVSRKIEDFEVRQDLREVLKELELPRDMGFILRTAGLGRTKREFQTDLHYLERLWKTVVQRIKSEPSPAALYQESDLLVRTIRDVLTSDFDAVVVDDEETAERAKEFLRIIMPRSVKMVEIYNGQEPLFHHYDLEVELERIYCKQVPLPSGGSLVIESTEALVAIDVNSGKYRDRSDPEMTAFNTDMEAAKEIPRQLRLRDLGGLIICDFIDLQDLKHKRELEKTLRLALKDHKERVQILRMSQFGIIEMTRQRQRAPLESNMFQDCPHCHGSGSVKSPETLTLDVMRAIQSAAHQEHVYKLTVTVPPNVGFFLLNRRRAALSQLEEELGRPISINMGPQDGGDQYTLEAEDESARPIKLAGIQPSSGADTRN